jgi:hypothetical protein
METRELKSLLDRELERLHKLVESGKEIAWATREITRINEILCPPPMVIASGDPGSLRYVK